MRSTSCAVFFLAAACGRSPAPGAAGAAAPEPDAAPPAVALPLEVESLGVQGFVLRHDDDVVLTAPLFSRGSLIDVSLGQPLPPDLAAIDEGVAGLGLEDVRAIVSGHAHYDHLMDVPRIMTEHAPDATLFANRTARHVLAALAPDRAPGCSGPAAAVPIARERVVALDDPAASVVDYRGCPEQRPAGAPLEGTWVQVPGARIRVLALCAAHPAQIGIIHFGEGSIDTDQCEPPVSANEWLEGQTLSFLIDFLDDDAQPVFRVYYQDAPGSAPIGNPPAEVLADRPVDLALLTAGNYDAVRDHPGEVLAALAPRVAISGHWEDFFQPADQPPEPLPFMDLDAYLARVEAGLPGRHVLAVRGTCVVVPPASE